jgi:hypothetical protein
MQCPQTGCLYRWPGVPSRIHVGRRVAGGRRQKCVRGSAVALDGTRDGIARTPRTDLFKPTQLKSRFGP